MQQLIACSESAFAFGEPDKIVLRNYEYLLPEDCLSLLHVRHGITDPKYGYRYKLLWDGITSFLAENTNYNINSDYYCKQLLVALVVLEYGPLFVDLRRRDLARDGRPEVNPDIDAMDFQFYILATGAEDRSPFIWPAIGRAYEIPGSVSQSELLLAKLWLNSCITRTGKHKECGGNEEPPLLPTRVVDVGSSDEETCLHISHSGAKGHYVALSHCWGGVVPVMTTTSNMCEFVVALPSKMPRTFVDAINVTRTMGHRYLWIDSLCIVQVSTEDWVTESAHMDQVYSQAIFTIVADAAKDSFSGFLQPPARNVGKTSIITCDTAAISERSNFHTMTFTLMAFGPATPGRQKSRKFLCVANYLQGPGRFKKDYYRREPSTSGLGRWHGSVVRSAVPAPEPTEDSNQITLRSLDNAWQRDIVEEYTQLDLTRETDRLSALAGVATRASTLRLGDQYMAGLWRQTIRAALPTWSWASITGQIRHARVADVPNDASLMEVISVEYIADGKSPMGAGPQKPASLLASGYLIPIDSVWFQPYDVQNDGHEIYRSCYRVKWPLKVAFPEDSIAMLDVHKANPPYTESIQLDRLDGMELDGTDFVMLLTDVSKGMVYGLLLSRRSSDRDVPEYERVGFVNGQDSMGEIAKWSSSSYSVSPMCLQDWEPDENGGLSSILENGNISKSTVKIW
ncbi:hypothetical protein LSUE1_G002792 [Lachnellula suecica]|uniref:Heterokaryon incompatibility domain-containing protein n=1 Tax=Lachnellula suecica TaxID=602035 RepID=A0A8T9C7D0_9HELO|nr:hypothetical protein LSUE1_G002792 [Lachnellula suecica]